MDNKLIVEKIKECHENHTPEYMLKDLGSTEACELHDAIKAGVSDEVLIELCRDVDQDLLDSIGVE